METLHEVMSEYQEHKKISNNEGSSGVKNLCRLVRGMGYKDTMYFGQFAQDGSYGDLIEFLEDNPGCVEAIKEWIGDQDLDEWRENLESELPPRPIKDGYDDGVCPDCQEEIPDDAVEGEECSNCGHVWAK